jgi:hypothetical protein
MTQLRSKSSRRLLAYHVLLSKISQRLCELVVVVSKHLDSPFHHLHQKRGVERKAFTLNQFFTVWINVSGKTEQDLDFGAHLKETKSQLKVSQLR